MSQSFSMFVSEGCSFSQHALGCKQRVKLDHLQVYDRFYNLLSCSRRHTCGAATDLLVHVQLGAVRDDLGGDGHAPRPQLHLLGLLPVVQSSTAHPNETHTLDIQVGSGLCDVDKPSCDGRPVRHNNSLGDDAAEQRDVEPEVLRQGVQTAHGSEVNQTVGGLLAVLHRYASCGEQTHITVIQR